MERDNRQTSKASNSSFLNKPPEEWLELASDRVLMSERCRLLPHRRLLTMQVPLAVKPQLAAAPFFATFPSAFVVTAINICLSLLLP